MNTSNGAVRWNRILWPLSSKLRELFVAMQSCPQWLQGSRGGLHSQGREVSLLSLDVFYK
jgi:hypothetical protein